jgi:hypothetical protein
MFGESASCYATFHGGAEFFDGCFSVPNAFVYRKMRRLENRLVRTGGIFVG